MTEDIIGGANFGIDTCWFDRTGANSSQQATPMFTVKSLYEVIETLEEGRPVE